MNAPKTLEELDKLNTQDLKNERKEIMKCIQSCDKELLLEYNNKLNYIDCILSYGTQLTINFDEKKS